MVDLRELKAGDIIVFKNGKKAEFLQHKIYHENNELVVSVNYKMIGGTLRVWDEYNLDGTRTKPDTIPCTKFSDDYDIVEIISKEQAMTEQTEDKVNHPLHYTSGGIECIEAIKASMSKDEYKGYLKGNVLKYIWRYKNKNNPVEDLKKAKVYLEWLIKEVER